MKIPTSVNQLCACGHSYLVHLLDPSFLESDRLRGGTPNGLCAVFYTVSLPVLHSVPFTLLTVLYDIAFEALERSFCMCVHSTLP